MKGNISQKFKNSYYNTLILDVDGVIFDSNKIKERNIHIAAKNFTNTNIANKFTPYFISLSGIPREKKINAFFKGQPTLAQKILKYYNELNDKSIYNAHFTKNADLFINYYHKTITLIALSGGASNEIEKLFDLYNLNPHFKYIFGGPKSKEENLNDIKLDKPILYIGDSIVDYETSKKINADFIFMHGYTGFENWQDFINKNDHVGLIENLQELLK